MSEKIGIAGWVQPPTDKVIAELVGSILHVTVGGTIEPGGTPWGEFFRFARVIKAELAPLGLPTTCNRCGDDARWQITVTWEAGYMSPDGNVVCEGCIDGVVTNGGQSIDFEGQV